MSFIYGFVEFVLYCATVLAATIYILTALAYALGWAASFLIFLGVFLFN